MVSSTELPTAQSRNYRKHTSGNLVQHWLLRRFQSRVAHLVAQGLHGCDVAAPRILDVGCGEGFTLAFLQERFRGLSFWGVDISGDALEDARRRCPEAVLIQGDAQALPFAAGSFHLVLCLEVLEHLPQPWRAVEELKRVSSGTLLVSVPHQPFFAAANLLRGKNLRTLGDDPEHLHRWTGGRFLSLLGEKAKVRQVQHSFPWLMVLAQIQ